MNARLTPEQELLRESAREVLARECPMSFVRATLEEPRAPTVPLHARLAELGWAGLALPERWGGAGLGMLELAVLQEEMGRVLAPGPFLATAIGGLAVLLGGSEAQRAALLPRVCDGSLRLALAWLEPGGGWCPRDVELEARQIDGGFALSGEKCFVLEGQLAERLLVAARLAPGDDGVGLFLVDPGAAGVELRPVPTLDLTRRHAGLRLRDVRVPADARLAGGAQAAGGGRPWLESLLDRARVALCAEMTGGAAAALERSVAFARVREQFGQPIGRFQAIQHKCADMLIRTEGARALTWEAAFALDAGLPEAHACALLAKAYCSEAFAFVAGEGIQIHGGLGYTWEQDPQLYYKRAVGAAQELGDPAWCRERAARAMFD